MVELCRESICIMQALYSNPTKLSPENLNKLRQSCLECIQMTKNNNALKKLEDNFLNSTPKRPNEPKVML